IKDDDVEQAAAVLVHTVADRRRATGASAASTGRRRATYASSAASTRAPTVVRARGATEARCRRAAERRRPAAARTDGRRATLRHAILLKGRELFVRHIHARDTADDNHRRAHERARERYREL